MHPLILKLFLWNWSCSLLIAAYALCNEFLLFDCNTIWVRKIQGRRKWVIEKDIKSYGEIYHVFSSTISCYVSFCHFFVSSSPPFKVTLTYTSLKNDFSQCQLNPAPTSVLFFLKKKLFLSFKMASWFLHDCHVLRNKQNKDDLLHNLIEGN